jgi:hypothetical protein
VCTLQMHQLDLALGIAIHVNTNTLLMLSQI